MAKQPKALHTKPRLGRGLSSLIAKSIQEGADDSDVINAAQQPLDRPATAPSAGLAAVRSATPEIPIDHIRPNPYQPRHDFDEEAMAELAGSIARQGILQPLVVSPAPGSPLGGQYVLVAGERRLRAARQAGLRAVPCVIRQATREQMLEWAIVENIHREDLNPIERAEAYRQYVDRFALTQAEAAERLGQPRATIANYLRILELCEEARLLIGEGRLSFGHGKVLAGLLEFPERQADLARRAAAEGLSVRQLEALLAPERSEAHPPGEVKAPRRPAGKAPYVRDLEERLSRAVGTRVTILPGRARNTGRMVIEYYSLDDFDRIAGALGLEGSP